MMPRRSPTEEFFAQVVEYTTAAGFDTLAKQVGLMSYALKYPFDQKIRVQRSTADGQFVPADISSIQVIEEVLRFARDFFAETNFVNEQDKRVLQELYALWRELPDPKSSPNFNTTTNYENVVKKCKEVIKKAEDKVAQLPEGELKKSMKSYIKDTKQQFDDSEKLYKTSVAKRNAYVMLAGSVNNTVVTVALVVCVGGVVAGASVGSMGALPIAAIAVVGALLALQVFVTWQKKRDEDKQKNAMLDKYKELPSSVASGSADKIAKYMAAKGLTSLNALRILCNPAAEAHVKLRPS